MGSPLFTITALIPNYWSILQLYTTFIFFYSCTIDREKLSTDNYEVFVGLFIFKDFPDSILTFEASNKSLEKLLSSVLA